MGKEKQYTGNRDPRFVSIHQGGTLKDSDHRLLAAWAADCAEHVIHYFLSLHPDDDRPGFSIDQARAWSRGEILMMQAREAAFGAHSAARETIGTAREAARAAGHAAATAHMADHELAAVAYAIKAVRSASPSDTGAKAAQIECQWQRDQLHESIKDLVLSDQSLRNQKFWSLFEC